MAEAQAIKIRQFVQQLAREDRYIVLLYYADGLTPIEIARILDLPGNRVRHRLMDLRTQLNGIAAAKPGKAATTMRGNDTLSGPQPTAFA